MWRPHFRRWSPAHPVRGVLAWTMLRTSSILGGIPWSPRQVHLPGLHIRRLQRQSRFYEACGANKLSQKIKAWRSRFKIEVKSLAPVIKSRLSLKPTDVKTSFQAVVTSTPSAKSARLNSVTEYIKYLVASHGLRDKCIYRLAWVSCIHA